MKQNPIDELSEQADRLYAARRDPRNVLASFELLRNRPDRAGDYETAWRLARALFFLGQVSAQKEMARSFHAQGVEAGQQAARIDSRRVEGHFWLAVNLALRAQVEPSLRAVRLAVRARQELQTAIAIDPTYHAAGPLRVLARIEQKLPRLLGGGRARAEKNYKEAIALAPYNTVTRIYFAELLIESSKTEQARRQLEAVLEGPIEPGWEFETERDRTQATELLKLLRARAARLK